MSTSDFLIREAELPEDAASIARIDRGFTTEEIFDVTLNENSILLNIRRLEKPLIKEFPLTDLHDSTRPWKKAFVVIHDTTCVGFAAVEYQEWNKRLVLWHFYIDTPFRNKGLGGKLINKVSEYGKEIGAKHIWCETSNLNVPGSKAYKRLGFELSGIDKTLYTGTKAENEVALFFSKAI